MPSNASIAVCINRAWPCITYGWSYTRNAHSENGYIVDNTTGAYQMGITGTYPTLYNAGKLNIQEK